MKIRLLLLLVAVATVVPAAAVIPSGTLAAPDSDVYVVIGPVAKPPWANGNVLAVEIGVGNNGDVIAVNVPVNLMVAHGQQQICESHTTLASVPPHSVVNKVLFFTVTYAPAPVHALPTMSYSVTARAMYVNEGNQSNNALTATRVFPDQRKLAASHECG